MRVINTKVIAFPILSLEIITEHSGNGRLKLIPNDNTQTKDYKAKLLILNR